MKQVLGCTEATLDPPLTTSITTTLLQGSVPCNPGSPPNSSYANSRRHSALDSEGADRSGLLLARIATRCSGLCTSTPLLRRTPNCLIQVVRTCQPPSKEGN